MNNELSTKQENELKEHLQKCTFCSKELADKKIVEDVLGGYKVEKAERSFITSLRIIQYQQKKKSNFYYLFSREMVLTSMLIFVALYIGVFLSFNTMFTDDIDLYQACDLYESVSLVGFFD